jgi:hypothetical protein
LPSGYHSSEAAKTDAAERKLPYYAKSRSGLERSHAVRLFSGERELSDHITFYRMTERTERQMGKADGSRYMDRSTENPKHYDSASQLASESRIFFAIMYSVQK